MLGPSDYDAILHAGCEAWNRLVAQPETNMSIGMRDWAHAGQYLPPTVLVEVIPGYPSRSEVKVRSHIRNHRGLRWYSCEIYRREWSGLSSAEKVYAGLEVLAQHNWLRIEHKETGGRRSDVLSIHPEFRRSAA